MTCRLEFSDYRSVWSFAFVFYFRISLAFLQCMRAQQYSLLVPSTPPPPPPKYSV